ncbi:ROK family protein [Streptomyces sp. NPDC057301]|uniref:ROK family transcriptional regulator n=1 Tax=Streptomyces sp. NPDC057301 TaxID=3346093 RepID=UPI003633DACE
MPKQSESALAQLRRSHEERVLTLLRKHGALSRREIGDLSGLSRTTLHDIISGLAARGAVVSMTQDSISRGRGRPAESVALNPAAGQAIGIDFARRHVHVAVVNMAHEVIGSADRVHPATLPWTKRVELAEQMIAELAEGAIRLGALTGIGVGVVGPVAGSGQEGAVRRLDVVSQLLRKRFGVPVLVDNNTRLAALGESVWGAAIGCQDVVYLRLSHGVGGGLVLGGSLHRGAYGISGEFGHTTVDPEGAACRCGGRGCLETVASVKALAAAHRAAGGRPGGFAGLLAAVEDGEDRALDLLTRAGALTGQVLAGVCNAVGPGLVVIGGELAEFGPAFLRPVEAALRKHVIPTARGRLRVRPAALGDAGAALGAIALVLHESPLLARYPSVPDTEETEERDNS